MFGGGGIIGFDFTYSAAETFYFSEVQTLRTSKLLPTEGVYLSESFLTSISLPASEGVYLSESFLTSISLPASEGVYLSESFLVSISLPASDGFSVDESFVKEHYVETIKSMERPYLTKITGSPIIKAIRGFQETGG